MIVGLALYFPFFILGALGAIFVLRQLRINDMFKPNSSFAIKLFYILTSIFSGHLLGSFIFLIYYLINNLDG